MCNSNGADSSARRRPNVLCEGGTSVCNSEGQIIYKLAISSPAIEDGKRTTHGAAVAVNNDWDCANLYGAGAPAGHRELEPIFDLDNLAATPSENDLLRVLVSLKPTGPGSVHVEATSGAANIKIWDSQTKGAPASQIALPVDLPTATLPKTIFVEGLRVGNAILEARYTSPEGIICSDRIKINVVELIERQGGARKIIYDYNTLINFEVSGGPANYEYEWDLDGDGSFNSKPFEVSNHNRSTAICKYGPAESADTVLLAENPGNKRKIYPVAVRLTGGLILTPKGTTRFGGGVSQGIRVSLGTFQGDPLPAQSTAGLHTIFHWNDNHPVRFDPTDAAHRGANRISYSATMVTAYAMEHPGAGLGAARRVFYVDVGPLSWTDNLKRAELIAFVNHEVLHLRQDVAVRDNVPPNNVWRLLDNFYGSAFGYADFNECESHFSELLDDQVGWFHLATGATGIQLFVDRYNACLTQLGLIPAGATRTAALTLIKDIYRNIPFDEMKRPGYDFYLRAPL